MATKCIRVRGKYVGDQFRVTEYQDVTDGVSSASVQFNSHNTIMNVLRMNRQKVSQRGFIYAFPIIFGQ